MAQGGLLGPQWGAGAQQGQLSGDTTNILSELGIDPNDFVQTGDQGLVYEGLDEEGEERVRPAGEYYRDLLREVPGNLPKLQRRLWEAGFYGRTTDWEDIRQGDYDEDTQQAWTRAVDRAAAFYDAGENRTLDEVIDMARYSGGGGPGGSGRGRGSGSGSGSGSGMEPAIRVSHPDDIRTIAMKTSTAVLGRGWTQEELDRFVGTYQMMERTAQSAARGGGTVTEAPSVQSAVERSAREAKPVESEGTDTVNAYGMVFNAMKRLGAGA